MTLITAVASLLLIADPAQALNAKQQQTLDLYLGSIVPQGKDPKDPIIGQLEKQAAQLEQRLEVLDREMDQRENRLEHIDSRRENTDRIFDNLTFEEANPYKDRSIIKQTKDATRATCCRILANPDQADELSAQFKSQLREEVRENREEAHESTRARTANENDRRGEMKGGAK